MVDSDTRVFDAAVATNWSAYQKARQGLSRAWDYCVVTSANQQQAAAYETELAWRRTRGKLPPATRFLVAPDPGGERIGSGGATLNALRAVYDDVVTRGEPAGEALWERLRILIIHSGGDSKRVPHLAPTGKAFGVLPLLDPEGQPITPFDQLFATVAGCAADMRAGMMVLSGDVLLVFDHRAVRAGEVRGVRGIAFDASAEMAAHFGVFVTDENGRVTRFLQKPSRVDIETSRAFDPSGNVKADSGIILFDGLTTAKCARLAGLNGGNDLVGEAVRSGTRIELYEDFTFALASETDRAAYLSGGSSAPIRDTIWTVLHGVGFDQVAVSPIRFVHIGTTEHYLDVAREAEEHNYGYRVARALHAGGSVSADTSCLIETVLQNPTSVIGKDSVLIGCHANRAEIGTRSIVSGLAMPGRDITIGNETVCMAVPLTGQYAGRFALLIFGTRDNPKSRLDDGRCGFCNMPMKSWLDRAGIGVDEIGGGSDHSLWEARLFPVLSGFQDIDGFQWIPQRAPSPEERDIWRMAERLSMAEALRQADCGKILALRDQIKSVAFREQIRERLGAEDDIRPLFRAVDTRDLCADAAVEIRSFAAATQSPFLRARAFRAAADLFAERLRTIRSPNREETGRVSLPGGALARWEDHTGPFLRQWMGAHDEAGPLGTLWKVHDELAFLQVAQVIEQTAIRQQKRPQVAVPVGERVVAEVPVRIDLGGGWTDTPPYSLEHGGAVTNVAILLNGTRPIRVTAYPVPEHAVVLASRDIGYSATITRCEPITRHDDPADPVALHKAALVLLGIIPAGARGDIEPYLRHFGAGIAIESECSLPKGSGLGTSSLLAAGLVAALNRLCGIERSMDELFQDVLCLEQMLTTGGGWQDQIGGAVGGYKLVETEPGVVQKPSIKTIDADSPALKEFEGRLVVYYTGAQRLAKNILRGVVGRYLSRDQGVFGALRDLRQVALDLWDSMQEGDIDRVGSLMNQTWRLNNTLNPGSSTPEIDDLMATIAPLCSGAKLVGAGGGGFLVALAKTPAAATELRKVLDAVPGEGKVFEHAIAHDGLVVTP